MFGMRCCMASWLGRGVQTCSSRCCQHRRSTFPVVQSVNPHGTLLSVSDGCGRCLSITGHPQTLQPQDAHHSEVVRVRTRCCTSCFEPVLSMGLNVINLVCGGCVVISPSAGYSIDSTCSTICVRCVVRASSSPMSPLASLYEHGPLPHPTGTQLMRRSSTWSGQVSTILLTETLFSMHGSDHRSVSLPFHLHVLH